VDIGNAIIDKDKTFPEAYWKPYYFF